MTKTLALAIIATVFLTACQLESNPEDDTKSPQSPQEQEKPTEETDGSVDDNSEEGNDESNEENNDNENQDDEESTNETSKPEQPPTSEQGLSYYSQAKPDLCLSSENNQVLAQACDNTLKQKWLLENNQIKWANNTNLCIEANSLANSEKLQLKNCSDSHLQQWTWKDNQFISANLAMDLNQNTSDVIVYGQHGNANQKWLLRLDSYRGNEDKFGPVDVQAAGPYGTQHMNVHSAQNWFNTGLFLKNGESAQIESEGTWTVSTSEQYGPEGSQTEVSRGCAEGSLVARIGLYYKDEAITCIGKSGTIKAHQDGIVYIGSVVSNDLGEAYETRKNAAGYLTVTVTSQGNTVPSIPKNVANYYDYEQVASGWVELIGKHSILTLPLETVLKDKAKLQDAIQRIDDIYTTHTELRGITPYHGQPIRWFPDTKDAPGWMLAGNPIRMDPALVDANSNDRISLAADPDKGNWGFAHELGHNFNFAGGDWYYTASTAGLETWPNIFSVHAQEKLDLPARELNCAEKRADYMANGSYEDHFKNDVWLALCFLLEFKDEYGWQFYKDFYNEFNQNPTSGWKNIQARFEQAAGEDLDAKFDEWKIPYE